MDPFLYLDLSKANPPSGPKPPPSPGSGAKSAGGPSSSDQGLPPGTIRYWKGVPHKKQTDGEWEPVKQAKGASKKPQDDDDAVENKPEATEESKPALPGQDDPGKQHSTNPEDFKEHDPHQHYMLAQEHSKRGYNEGAEAHKRMANEKSKDMGPEDHAQLAEKLKEQGMPDEAALHEKQSKKEEKPKDGAELSGQKQTEEKRREVVDKETPVKGSKKTKASSEKKSSDSDKKEEATSPEVGNLEKQRHQEQAKELYENILTHPVEENEERVANAGKLLQRHMNMKGEPSEDDKKELRRLKSALGDYAKPNKEHVAKKKEEEKAAKEKEKADQKAQEKQSAEEPKPPENDVEHAKVADHKSQAQDLKDSIQAHMDSGDLSPDDEERLQRVVSALEEHTKVDKVPSKDQSKELKELQKLAGEQGKESKAPKEEEASEQKEDPKGKDPNYLRTFKQSRAAGESAGQAAIDPYGGGRLGSDALAYASTGAVRGGHHLLKDDGKKEEAPAKTKKKQGAEQAQSSMETQKSLSLYLALQKGANIPNAGKVTPTESKAKTENLSSYAKRPVGVAGGGESLKEDDPDVGRKWKHSEEDSVEVEVEEDLEDKEKKEDKAEKAADLAADMLKSLNSSIRQELSYYLPTELEAQFMVDVLEYDPSAVKKGLKFIRGKDRHRFNEWAHERLAKSLDPLIGRFS